MRWFRQFGRSFVAIVLTIFNTAALLANPAGFAGWPQPLIENYKRFENYIAARQKNSVDSKLEILEDGKILHHIPFVRSRGKNLSIEAFRNGRTAFSISAESALSLNLVDSGEYAACLKSSGISGYQYIYPLVRFEVLKERSKWDSVEMKIRMRSSKFDETVWPNTRLLLFLDYHVFPTHNPDDIRDENRRVTSPIKLQVDNSGNITREKIQENAIEKLLCWRIYRNGNLVNDKAVNKALELPSENKTGSYIVFMGVDGPNGFMPVSNLLEFPLFPDVSGKTAVFPKNFSKDALPDCVNAILEKNYISKSGRISGNFDEDKDGDGISDAEEQDNRVAILDDIPQEDRLILELWNAWSFNLLHRYNQKKIPSWFKN